MKKYDISDNFRNRTHTVRVTFQYQEYKGHIEYVISGNCRGLNVMNPDLDCMNEEDINDLKYNDCLEFNSDYKELTLRLKDDEGNESIIEDDEINDYIVAVEIVDCKIEGEN